jgi:hypothetical protein
LASGIVRLLAEVRSINCSGTSIRPESLYAMRRFVGEHR